MGWRAFGNFEWNSSFAQRLANKNIECSTEIQPSSSYKASAAAFRSLSMRMLILLVVDLAIILLLSIDNHYCTLTAQKYQYNARKL